MNSLIKIFDEVISKPRKKSSKKSAPSIKPSMLGTACMRKLYYSYNKVEEDQAFPLNVSRIVKLGNYIGDMLSDVYREAGIIIDYVDEKGQTPTGHDGRPNHEFPISSPELDIKLGFIDLVAVMENELWLGEFKSINSFGYGKLRGPKPDHLIQGIIYLYVFNKLLREGKYKHIKALDGFDKAIGIKFVYVNKDTSVMKEFTVTTADEQFKQIVMKIQTVKQHTAEKVLPGKTPEYCNSCPWAKKCAKNFNIQ